MMKTLGSSTRAWMLCAVALLWAWEAAADDPPSAAAEVASASAEGESFGDLSSLWDIPSIALDRVRGGR